MSRYDLVETFIVLVISVINIGISYLITCSLGIQNVVLCHNVSSINGDITYEVIIFMFLAFIEASFYHYKFERDFA